LHRYATGITDIDELVTTFINAEDENFRLFNYVNELNQVRAVQVEFSLPVA
jgi:membrane carboxypeptidase/penicillin-binding protein PbpC